ncbi:MAG: M1 family aminopeptidase [Nitrospinota bacterium]|nr:M1 family aminopeptidase [Nitrospinota bacterium]
MVVLCMLAGAVPRGEAAPWVRPTHHDLEVTLDPAGHSAHVADLVTLYPSGYKKSTITFLLHANYKTVVTEIPHQGDWHVEIDPLQDGQANLQTITVHKPRDLPWPDFLQIKFFYNGPYTDALRESDEPPPGTDGEEKDHGIFLSGASYFYPIMDDKDGTPLITFSLSANLPAEWKVVSQGKRVRETTVNGPRHTFWQCDDPMQEIFLIADHFEEYSDTYEDVKLYVFLRKQEKSLASKYLEAAKSYIAFYEKLIGAYPFVKFAVVENALQTGYGMPSFTLLGSRVIRFPFILHTSYPHEILHNWWGNGVYVKPGEGNWSEGLTAYLSDHLFPDLKGQGDRYRFQELMKYSSYVNADNDFPLTKFRERTDMASQAIGYGKLVMVLNMLRLELGDAVFLKALSEFFITQKFRHAGFDALRGHFEAESGKKLDVFFRQWVGTKGAPELELADASYEDYQGEYRLSLSILQKQKRPLFDMTLPVAVWMEGDDKPQIQNLKLESKSHQELRLFVKREPKAVMVDPYYDLFRKLDPREAPSSIGQSYGAPAASVVFPQKETKPLRSAYEQFSQHLDKPVKTFDDTTYLPAPNAALWLFGKDNAVAQSLKLALGQFEISFQKDGIAIEGKTFEWENNSFVFTVPHPHDPNRSATWIIADDPESIPGLIRKLPHYGKYGALVFQGKAPTNVYKNTWPAQRIGLMKTFQPGRYKLPKRPPLVPFQPE